MKRKRTSLIGTCLALAGALCISGCGGGATTPADAGSAGSAGMVGSDGAVNAGLAGVTADPISTEDLGKIMRENNSQMKLLKLAMREKDADMAIAVLDAIADGAKRAMGSKPRKKVERMAAYLSLFGAQRATALGLKALVKVPAWEAMGPSLKTLGKNCMQCHTQFRLTEAEEMAGQAK